MSNYDNRGCCIEGCKRRYYAKGMCEMHYTRVRRNGDTHYNGRTRRRDPVKWLLCNFKEDYNGCWIWQGRTGGQGYGVMKVGLKNQLTHRLSYQYFNGNLSEDICVLHSCDVPGCINPDHLFLGTSVDNNRDREEKGRGVRGEQMPHAKLTDDIVRYARESGRGIQSLADEYSVSHETMRLALNKTTWRHA